MPTTRLNTNHSFQNSGIMRHSLPKSSPELAAIISRDHGRYSQPSPVYVPAPVYDYGYYPYPYYPYSYYSYPYFVGPRFGFGFGFGFRSPVIVNRPFVIARLFAPFVGSRPFGGFGRPGVGFGRAGGGFGRVGRR